MVSRPLVFLDAAGVLFFEDELRVADRLALTHSLECSEVHDWLEGEAYVPWWSGAWDWADFWAAFEYRFECRVGDRPHWQSVFSRLRPMHSLSFLSDWSSSADLWLLSDHRSDWLLPALGNHARFFSMICLSDQMGLTKRDPAFFELIACSLDPSYSTLYYLDDRAENLRLASQAMPQLKTFRADPAGLWTTWLYRSLAHSA